MKKTNSGGTNLTIMLHRNHLRIIYIDYHFLHDGFAQQSNGVSSLFIVWWKWDKRIVQLFHWLWGIDVVKRYWRFWFLLCFFFSNAWLFAQSRVTVIVYWNVDLITAFFFISYSIKSDYKTKRSLTGRLNSGEMARIWVDRHELIRCPTRMTIK